MQVITRDGSVNRHYWQTVQYFISVTDQKYIIMKRDSNTLDYTLAQDNGLGQLKDNFL